MIICFPKKFVVKFLEFPYFRGNCTVWCQGKPFFCPECAQAQSERTLTKQHRRNQMKFNKWTLGLAALGVVSLASAARADEAKLSQVQTALSNTTLSGYVDTSMEWNPTGGGVIAPVAYQGVQANGNGPKSNGFSLNVVDLALDKPEDAGPWAAGYHVELWLGPDAATLGSS